MELSNHQFGSYTLGGVVAFFLFFNSAYAQTTPEAFIGFDRIYSQELAPEYDEYNFWNGHWDNTWKTWKELDTYVVTGNTEHRVFSVLDGKVLIELAYTDSIVGGSKTAGFSIRYFDSNLEKWVMLQSWPGRNSPNMSSLQGTHHHSRIQVYQFGTTSTTNKYVPAGTPFANRYTFSDVTDESFRWDSSFSTDSMRTWFTRDIAEFNRMEDFNSLKEPGTNTWYTYGDGYNCDDSLLQDLKPFLGEWEGKKLHKGKKLKASRVLMPALSNCAALGYQITEGANEVQKEFFFTTYLPNSAQWVFYSINNMKGESQTLYFAKTLDGGISTFDKQEIFDVPSSNPVEMLKWQFKGNNKHQIEAYDANDALIYRMEMNKME